MSGVLISGLVKINIEIKLLIMPNVNTRAKRIPWMTKRKGSSPFSVILKTDWIQSELGRLEKLGHLIFYNVPSITTKVAI